MRQERRIGCGHDDDGASILIRVGPRDAITDDALGGQLYYIGTAQVTFPIGLPNEFGILGNLFTDFGTVTRAVESGPLVDTSNSLRVAAGIGGVSGGALWVLKPR